MRPLRAAGRGARHDRPANRNATGARTKSARSSLGIREVADRKRDIDQPSLTMETIAQSRGPRRRGSARRLAVTAARVCGRAASVGKDRRPRNAIVASNRATGLGGLVLAPPRPQQNDNPTQPEPRPDRATCPPSATPKGGPALSSMNQRALVTRPITRRHDPPTTGSASPAPPGTHDRTCCKGAVDRAVPGSVMGHAWRWVSVLGSERPQQW